MPGKRRSAIPLNEGHLPSIKGQRRSVQGGYVPTVGQAAPTPPTGGSGVIPPKSSK